MPASFPALPDVPDHIAIEHAVLDWWDEERIFQRYKALRGFDLRYQNGFDCQGLWVEVEVERSLGLNSKREIEEYGLARFARACRERVKTFAEVQTNQSKRLGQWMDWERSYFTLSD